MTVDPASLTDLPRLLSAPRFNTYLHKTSNQGEALRLYTWNIEVSSAIWSELHALEVVIRNSLHDTLEGGFGRDDWWNHPQVVFHNTGRQQMTKAQNDASRACQRKGKSVTPDDIVAALSFGFWISLIGLGAAQQYETLFWQPHLIKAFPGYSGTRGQLSTDLETTRLLRNRIAHHEPIFDRHLWGDHLRAIRIAGYINHDAATYINSQSRVDSVLGGRGACVRLGLGTSF